MGDPYGIVDHGAVTMMVRHRLQSVRTVSVVDETRHIIAVCYSANDHIDNALVYAERLAELLSRHGLGDVPDGMGWAAPSEEARRG